MDTHKIKREYRLKQWSELIQHCLATGQTVSAWCAENSINPKQYYYWLRRVRMAACETLSTSNEKGGLIVPVSLAASYAPSILQSTAPVVIRLEAASIEIHQDASPELIANILMRLPMLGNITQTQQIYIACGHTDMRKSIEGLVMLSSRVGPSTLFNKAYFYSAAADVTA